MRTAKTLLIGTAIAALLATGCEWQFETLDGAGGPNGRITGNTGWYNTAVVYDGRPHVFGYDDSGGNLRHGYWNGFFWVFETLDGTGGPNGRLDGEIGMHAAAMLYNGRPHVFYYDGTRGDLRHAYWNGFFWVFETLDGNGGPNGRTMNSVGRYNAAVLYNGRPHVFYEDLTGKLRHAYYTGAAWGFETLDGAGGPNGRTTNVVGNFGNSVELYNGRPHVFYRDNTATNLRHAYYNGSAWFFETLDGAGGTNGRIAGNVGSSSEVFLYNGRPHVFYVENAGMGDNDLRHGYWNGLFWAFETLDGAGGPNGRVDAAVGGFSQALVYNARPHVFYNDASDDTLRHAYYNGAAWFFETLDGNGGTNGRVNAELGVFNAAILYNGRPDVFYRDTTNGDLRHAYFG